MQGVRVKAANLLVRMGLSLLGLRDAKRAIVLHLVADMQHKDWPYEWPRMHNWPGEWLKTWHETKMWVMRVSRAGFCDG